MALEDWFGQAGGTVSDSIEDLVWKGEREIDLRIKILRLANKASWMAVDNYVIDHLC